MGREGEIAARGGEGGFAVEELLRGGAFAHPVGDIELIQTHISWVILTGSHAYKIKKPVRFDFLDASSLERRRELCEEEIRLNRRLAPQLYLAVVPIGRLAGQLVVGADGEIVEYAVQMRQFDRADELAALLARGEVHHEEVSEFAERLAAFHAALPAAAPESPFGTHEQVRAIVLGNVSSLLDAGSSAEFQHALERLGAWTQQALAEGGSEIEARRADGAVRECHGDLHARNIVRWQGRLLPFDCLEFNPSMRWIDVASEMAFLHMDLLGHDRPDLASVLLNRYLECNGDYHGLRLLRFYGVYRALVRAKVDALQARSTPAGTLREELRARFLGRLQIAQRLAEPPDPFLVITCGVSGSGKSWLSGQCVAALGAIRLRSDLERKRITGGDAPAPSARTIDRGRYAARPTDRTYARLLECAESALAGGQNVLVDAAFLDPNQRELFIGLARRAGVRFLILVCDAAPATLRERVRAREAAGTDASEATLAVLEHQLRTRRPLDASELEFALELDTTAMRSAASAIAAIRERLGRSASP